MTRYHTTTEGGIPFTPEEEVERDAEEAAVEAAKPNNAVLAQITALEATMTKRRQREATLGTDNGWLASLDAQIAKLRSQLK